MLESGSRGIETTGAESDMDSMIERVARAIYKTEPFEVRLREERPWVDVHERQKVGFRIKAQAAIEAMRVPTQEMRVAMGSKMDWVNGHADWEAIFGAAIDTAVKQQE